jgi:hypothetical protein
LDAGEEDSAGWWNNTVNLLNFTAKGPASTTMTGLAKAKKLPELTVFKVGEEYYAYKNGKAYPIPEEPYDLGPNSDENFLSRKFSTGGLADFTGPAWLDGTKSHPELVLNQQDTANFIQLKDILSEILAGTSSITNNNKNTATGDNYYDIDISVENIEDDYDVEQMAEKIKDMIYEDATARNVNTINSIS